MASASIHRIEGVWDCLNKENYDDDGTMVDAGKKKYLDPRVCKFKRASKGERSNVSCRNATIL